MANLLAELRSTPRWVKVFGIIALVLVLLFVIILVTDIGGDHGPGRHIPSGDAGGDRLPIEEVQPGHTPPIQHGVQQP